MPLYHVLSTTCSFLLKYVPGVFGLDFIGYDLLSSIIILILHVVGSESSVSMLSIGSSGTRFLRVCVCVCGGGVTGNLNLDIFVSLFRYSGCIYLASYLCSAILGASI